MSDICNRSRQEIAGYLAGESPLSADSEKHVKECPVCSQVFQNGQSLVELLKKMPDVTHSESRIQRAVTGKGDKVVVLRALSAVAAGVILFILGLLIVPLALKTEKIENDAIYSEPPMNLFLDLHAKYKAEVANYKGIKNGTRGKPGDFSRIEMSGNFRAYMPEKLPGNLVFKYGHKVVGARAIHMIYTNKTGYLSIFQGEFSGKGPEGFQRVTLDSGGELVYWQWNAGKIWFTLISEDIPFDIIEQVATSLPARLQK